MRTHAKYILLALAAVIATAFVASTASAVTISASPAGSIKATSLGKLTFAGTEPTLAIECNVTLNGRLNTTIEDAARGRVGTVTEGIANECGTNKSAQPLFEGGAWELELARATELRSSPKLATINNNRTRFLIDVIGVRCKYEGQVPTSLEAEGSPIVTRLLAVLRNSPTRIEGGAFCSRRAELRGSFRITTQTLTLR